MVTIGRNVLSHRGVMEFKTRNEIYEFLENNKTYVKE
jgi:hypothetical protein